jgi:hypothetical protein
MEPEIIQDPQTAIDLASASGTPTAVSTTTTPIVTTTAPTNNNPTTTRSFFDSSLSTAPGDGQLDVVLGLTGSFSGASYDPLGEKPSAGTTFSSRLSFRVGDTGRRQNLSSIATNQVGVESSNTSTTSRFNVSGLQFELVQSVSDSIQGSRRTGSSLSQVYQITNPTNQSITFELVRYFDGDLRFDGSIADSGGRIVRNGRDILFETDSGDNPAAPNTFVGITANGGTPLATNRYEISGFSDLSSTVSDGDPLSNTIRGDTNGDSFVDTAPYDLALGFRNVFTLAPGESTNYIAETLFGTGVPTQIILPETITVAATDYTAIEDTKDPAVFTLTRTNGNLTKPLTVSYTLSGKAISGEDYTASTNTVTFAAGETTATVSIDPINDGILEGSESVVLTLESKPAYNLSDRGRQSRIAIADDINTIVDLPPTVSIDNITQREGNSGTTKATFNVTLNKASELDVTVDYEIKENTAKAGEDFFAAFTNTLVFAPGEVSKEVTIDIVGDRVDEPDETFQVVLSEPTNATLSNESAAIATIVNDDPLVSLSVSDGEAAETIGGETTNPGQFLLRRRGDLSKPLTVKYALGGTSTNEDDYRQLSDTAIFGVGIDRLEINIDPFDDKIAESSETIGLTVLEDPNYTIDSTASNGGIIIADNNDSPVSRITRSATNLLEVDGGTNNTILKFTKVSAQSRDANEIAAFTVDDDLGSINGIKPGESGYLAAALDRAQVVFSVLGNSGFNNNAERSSERYLNIPPGKRIEFLNIAQDTLETVRADFAAGKEITNVSFSVAAANGGSGDRARLSAANSDSSAYEIGWETDNNANKDFKDLVLKVEAIDSLTRPVGTNLQGRQDNQVVDLRGFGNGQIFISTATVGDASYRNNVGFYEVEDTQGTLANGLKPGDVGYAEAAVSGAILRDRSNRQVDSSLPITGGKILAPVVIANGTFGEFLTRNPQNNIDPNQLQAYFNFKGANPDKIDHFRLLGDNKFAVEDMYGGGDRDFNDIIFQLNVRAF